MSSGKVFYKWRGVIFYGWRLLINVVWGGSTFRSERIGTPHSSSPPFWDWPKCPSPLCPRNYHSQPHFLHRPIFWGGGAYGALWVLKDPRIALNYLPNRKLCTTCFFSLPPPPIPLTREFFGHCTPPKQGWHRAPKRAPRPSGVPRPKGGGGEQQGLYGGFPPPQPTLSRQLIFFGCSNPPITHSFLPIHSVSLIFNGAFGALADSNSSDKLRKRGNLCLAQ